MNLIPWRTHKRDEGDGGSGAMARLPSLRNEIDGLFDHFFRNPFGSEWSESIRGWGGGLSTDLAESGDEVTVRMELPGVEAGDVDINVTANMLTVSGEKQQEQTGKESDYHFVERRFGSFRRSVQLPSTVDPDKVEAVFKNGVLTVTIAKRPEARPRKIKVTGG